MTGRTPAAVLWARAASGLLIAALLAVSVGTTYAAARSNLRTEAHSCCRHDQAPTACYTLCAAERSTANLGATANWQPPALVAVATPFMEPLRTASTDPAPLQNRNRTGASPPPYILFAAFLN